MDITYSKLISPERLCTGADVDTLQSRSTAETRTRRHLVYAVPAFSSASVDIAIQSYEIGNPENNDAAVGI
jgi:hypothetical protein